jgi:hypothetical protein
MFLYRLVTLKLHQSFLVVAPILAIAIGYAAWKRNPAEGSTCWRLPQGQPVCSCFGTFSESRPMSGRRSTLCSWPLRAAFRPIHGVRRLRNFTFVALAQENAANGMITRQNGKWRKTPSRRAPRQLLQRAFYALIGKQWNPCVARVEPLSPRTFPATS